MSKEALKLALEALEKCRDGFEFTRQYVGCETLPAIEGWSWYDGDVAAKAAITVIKQALAQPAQQERNFCPRCGKRTADLTVIHTCTPPQKNT